MRDIGSILADFGRFYAEIHGGNTPYAWQRRLVEDILSAGKWPDLVSAPTGAGKTIVIDIHVFLNAVAGEAQNNPEYPLELQALLNGLPRRMAVLAPRRALVDDQSDASIRIQQALEWGANVMARRVRKGLQARAGAPWVDGGQTVPPALLVDTVRGAMPRRRFLEDDAWQTHPTYCALIHMTPDMFGSAILFRHYAAGTKRRPQDAGLLAVDTVAVIDEGHLQQQLTLTARRIESLDEQAPNAVGRPLLQVVATTATPGISGADHREISVTEADLHDDEELGRRLAASKPITLVREEGPAFSVRSVTQAVDLLWELKLDAQERGNPGPVGFIANTVRSAVATARALREKMRREGHDADRVFSVVGRMRPVDRLRDLQLHPGIFTPEGNDDVDFIVSTQVLEVGIDVDFSALVTQLASPSALAQRAGRLNRRGLGKDAPLLVLLPQRMRGFPYSDTELKEGRLWLERLEGDASPWAIHTLPPVPPELSRRALQRLEIWDAEYFAATSERLVGEGKDSSLDLWIRDSFADDTDISLVVRGLPPDDVMASQILEVLPPDTLEQMPASLVAARKALSRYLNSPDTEPAFARCFVWDPVEKTATVYRGGDDLSADPLRKITPGTIVIVDVDAALFEGGIFSEDGGEALPDVHSEALAARVLAPAEPRILRPFLHVDGSQEDHAQWTKSYNPLPPAVATLFVGHLITGEDDADHTLLPDEFVENDWGRDALLGLDPQFFGSRLQQVNVIVDDVEYPRIVVLAVPPGSWDTREEIFETTSKHRSVRLTDHSQAVAQRVKDIAEVLRLPSPLLCALETAAALHDEGKRDLRFQAVLRLRPDTKPGEVALAKSAGRSWQRERRIRSLLDLRGWRHEQLSAAIADAELPEDIPERGLIIRLVGTTHGYGRGLFDANAKELIHALSGVDSSVNRSAQALYDAGTWDHLVVDTQLRWGTWGTAYLEALLRAADVTVSQEGG